MMEKKEPVIKKTESNDNMNQPINKTYDGDKKLENNQNNQNNQPSMPGKEQPIVKEQPIDKKKIQEMVKPQTNDDNLNPKNQKNQVLSFLPLGQIIQMLTSYEDTTTYYKLLLPLFESTFTFSTGIITLIDGEQSEEGIKNFNVGFRAVGDSVKAMVLSLPNYTKALPQTLSARIFQCANKVKIYAKDLVTFARIYNKLHTGMSTETPDKDDVVQTTGQFVIATLELFIESFRSSLVDDIYVSANESLKYIDDLVNILTNESLKTQESFSSTVNNLQNITLKLTSILRSRCTDISLFGIQDQVTKLIEETENAISNLMDEARKYLLSNKIEYTHALDIQLKTITNTLNGILKLRAGIELSIINKLNITDMHEIIQESLTTTINGHLNETNEYMSYLISNLRSLMPALSQIFEFYQFAKDNSLEWFRRCTVVITHIDNIKSITESLKSHIAEPALKISMISYLSTMNHLEIQFKILATALCYGVESNYLENEFINFLSPLKDFAFLCFPFSYNFKDATNLLQGSE